MEGIEKLRELASTEMAWMELAPSDLERIADEIEHEIAELYMPLPVDADGVPWTKSDKVFFVENEQSPRNITAFSFEFAENRWLIEDDDCCTFYADECTHAKPDHVKELLEELVAKVENDVNWRCNASDEIDCMTARIREVVDA